MNDRLKNLLNGQSIYLWRVLIIVLFGILGFFGTRLYAQIDRNSIAIYEIAKNTAKKSDVDNINSNINDLRKEIIEIYKRRSP